jgi:hypothetical protein
VFVPEEVVVIDELSMRPTVIGSENRERIALVADIELDAVVR